MRSDKESQKIAIAAHQNIKEKEFWLKKLDGELVKSCFPYDYKRKKEMSEHNFKTRDFALTGELFSQLRYISGGSDHALHMIFTAAIVLLLGKYTYNQRKDILVGVPIYKQMEDKEFINTVVVLRNRFNTSFTFKELLLQVKQKIVEALENQNYPIEMLVEQLKPGLAVSIPGDDFPLFDVAVLCDGIHHKKYLEHLNINMTFSFSPPAECIEGMLTYNASRYKETTGRRIITQLTNLMKTILTNVDTPLMGIDFFTEEEKHQLLVDFNRVNINREPSELSPDKTIHRLFREMAAKSPGDTALLFEGDCLTYGELDKKSNQLAHLIRKKGIGPDHIVGIMLDYCLEMIIGVLAVLKSGAAYLPITPETPPSRIRSMLRDSNCSLLLTREKSIKDLSYIALQDFEAIGIVPYLSLPRPQVEELDALQVPDRSSIDYEKYRPYIGQAMVKNSITIHMSRGCVFNCAYCFKIWPKKYIIRSAENIFNEIRLYHDMGIRRFAFVDDLPNINMKVSSKVFRLIIQNGLKVHLHFPNGIRGDILTKEYIDLMVEAGTITMDLALETTSPRLQKLIRKNLNLKRLADNIQYITEKHPHVILELQIIHGIPSETEEEARQSLEFIKNIKWVHFPYIHILNIYPRSDMAEIAVKHGISGEAIRRSADLAYHELPETLPFPGSFTRKYQSEFLNEYFLSKERLLSVLPYQMKVLTEDELVQKYNSYLPAEISTFSQLLEYAGISRDQLDGEFLPEGYGVVPGLNEKLAAHFGPLRNPTGQKALRVLLLDLSQYFTHDTKIMYDVVEPPLGLMYVLTHLNRTFGSKINVKIAKSRIDFDSHERLKALLLDLKPDVIGIRTLNFYKDFFHKTISLIRQWGVNVPIIAGGPYATSNYPTMLNDKNIDLAVVGEGEIIFAEVIAKILQNNGKLPGKETLKGIPGLAFVEEDHPLRKRHNREVLLLDKIMDTLSQESGQNPEHINRTADLAYIIYTSGSTGAPKGVMIQHRNLVNQIMALRNEFDLDASLHYLLLASFTFDVSIMHIFLPLTTGAKLFLITDETRKESAKLWQFIFENKITVLNIVPTFMSALLESIEKKKISFKYLFVGGDVFPAKLYNGLQETFNFEQVINIYGPTETTINALLYRLPENLSREIIPIGRPLMSYSVYIVDSDLNPVPVEVSGELCISGRGVARGYLNHPELTAEKFRSAVTGSSKSSPNDQCPMTNDRFYRTGDLARWLPDGNVEFIGRIDRQVKVRGFRIELGEIEKHLSRIDNVKEVLVITNQSTEGDKYISAYIVSEKPFKPSHLRDYLKNRLPGYMIPSYFIPIKRIPVTPGGKVDKKQLPDPQITGDYVAPRDNIDAKLVALWAAVLAKDANRIGIDTNFFELGGHSLKATILISRIHKEFNTRIPMVEFFSTPTIRGLSRYIKDTEDERFVVIAKAEKKDYYVLSSSQKRLFVLQRLEPENTVYNMPVLLEMEGKIDKERLENCFKKLIGRHDNLKTSFEMIKSGLVQRIRDQVEFSIEYFDLSATGDTAKMRHQHSSRIIHDFVRPFELSHPPLLRVGLVKLGEKKQIYMMDMHHIITDGVSMNIFTKEIMALYQRMELPGINIQYRDYSEWQHSEKVREVIKKQEAYWMKQFQVPPPALNLPFDYPRPAVQSFEGSSVGFGIGIEKTGKLKELALKEDVTLFVLLLTVSTLFLSKISGQEDITVGTPIAGRQHADLEYILGVFINMLALRNYPKGEKNFKEFLAEVKKTTLDALENQGYPFEDLVEKTPVERDVGRNPLFDVFFSLDNHQLTHGEIDNIEIPELNSKQYGYENPISKFDLSFYAADLGQNLHFTLEYCNKLFKRETIEAFSLYFKKIVSSILEDPCKKLAQIEIIPGEEKHRVLYDFNNTGAEFSRDKTIHRLFEEQVVKTPGRIAIVGTVPGAGHGAQGMDKHCVLTYSELNRKSNQLAHQLRKKEVKPGTIVGIMVERSIEMILGIIAILKAGGAYLPSTMAYRSDL